jgi:hypothetical protein
LDLLDSYDSELQGTTAISQIYALAAKLLQSPINTVILGTDRIENVVYNSSYIVACVSFAVDTSY